jgi:hypothetical protein
MTHDNSRGQIGDCELNPSANEWIIVCSDSVGETAEAVVRATMRQFQANQVKIKRYSQVATEDAVREVIEDARSKRAFIAYTLVQPELRETMKMEAIKAGVRTVDIMGPMMQAFIDTFNDYPLSKPGLLHRMDEDYFRRVEAIEFSVKYDDGRDARGILKAEIVLIGVSRTSKTPLSIFLAHKGYKVANFPVVPEVKVPKELFEIPPRRIIGLTMDPEQILRIRSERLKSLGLTNSAKYATLPRILEELEYAEKLMKSLGCLVIDVTDKAIEETAGLIIDYIQN